MFGREHVALEQIAVLCYVLTLGRLSRSKFDFQLQNQIYLPYVYFQERNNALLNGQTTNAHSFPIKLKKKRKQRFVLELDFRMHLWMKNTCKICCVNLRKIKKEIKQIFVQPNTSVDQMRCMHEVLCIVMKIHIKKILKFR